MLLYFYWLGSAEELKELEETLTNFCAKADGVEYKGLYAPDNRKFHFVNVYEVESYDKLIKVLTNSEMSPRDYKKLTNWMFKILRGPLK